MRRIERTLLQQVVARFTVQLGCLSFARVAVLPLSSAPNRTGYAIEAAGFQPMELQSRVALWLTAAQHVQWQDQTSAFEEIGYAYRVGQGENGHQEVLAYHWDQFSLASGVRFPHMHVGRSVHRPSQLGQFQDFHKRHIPTGHVTFPMVVRFLIDELSVEPLNPNWDKIRSETGPA